jgi:dipeptidase E
MVAVISITLSSRSKAFSDSARKVLFFPFALFERDAYAAKAKARFAAMGYSLETVHAVSDPREAIEQTDAIFIGGGNTFRLLKALQDLDLVDPIRRKVEGGAPYIGSSAGSNVAGPTIKTTKDMPIVQPRSFDSLGLVPFQISPHFRTQIPIPGIWARHRRKGLFNFSKRTKHPLSEFEKVPGWSAKTARSH